MSDSPFRETFTAKKSHDSRKYPGRKRHTLPKRPLRPFCRNFRKRKTRAERAGLSRKDQLIEISRSNQDGKIGKIDQRKQRKIAERMTRHTPAKLP